MKNYFWYSERQKVDRKVFGQPTLLFCEINGKVLEYTEWLTIDKKSNYNDAVLLGIGKFHHSGTVK